jgi:hypothetical protein
MNMSRKTRCLSIAVSWLMATTTFAQEDTSAQPKTKLERFQAKSGAVLITNSTKVGTLDGKLGSSIAVQAREITDANDGSKLSGLAITVSDQRRGGRQSTSYIDLDEIDPFLKAIDTIEHPTNFAKPQARTDYRTKYGLAISRLVSERARGEIIAVQSGWNPPVRASFDVDDLAKLKEIIAKAQSVLEPKKQQSD